MKSVIILLLIIFFLATGYFLNYYLQKLVMPRQSFFRLLLYLFIMLSFVFLLSFFLVLVVTKLYPEELIK